MGISVDWKLVNAELSLKRQGEGFEPGPCAAAIFNHFPNIPYEKHLNDFIDQARTNFGEALHEVVQKFWDRKFRSRVDYDRCYRGNWDSQTLLCPQGYHLGQTLFYSEEKLTRLEKVELRYYILHYFAHQGVDLRTEELHIERTVDRERPEWSCYVISL